MRCTSERIPTLRQVCAELPAQLGLVIHTNRVLQR